MPAVRNLFENFHFFCVLNLLDFLLKFLNFLLLPQGFCILVVNFSQKFLDFWLVLICLFFLLKIPDFYLVNQFVIILLQLHKIFLFCFVCHGLLFWADVSRFCGFYCHRTTTLLIFQSRTQGFIYILGCIIQKRFEGQLAVGFSFFRKIAIALLHLRIFGFPQLGVVHSRAFSLGLVLHEINGPICLFRLRLLDF